MTGVEADYDAALEYSAVTMEGTSERLLRYGWPTG